MAVGGLLLGQSARCTKKKGKMDAEECVGPNPTDRSKAGVKKSLLVEAGGGPLAVCISGANVNDATLLKATLESVVVERPEPTEEAAQHLCLDKGYDNRTGEGATVEAGYVPHIRRIGEEKKDERGEKTHPARRWVVERTFGWLSRWRGILIRWENKADNYLACVKLACALLWYRRCYCLGVLR
jgi:putative transposase